MYPDFMNTQKLPTQTELARTLAVEIRAIHRSLKLRVREHGGSKELTPAQVAVLARLETDGMSTVSSLARAEGMRPQSMREIVTPLQEAGFINGKPDPDDGRQTLMSLTPKCIKWIKDGRAASHDWLSQTISRKLSIQDQRTLRDALELLRKVVAE
jgi:DNA-binding MarR family transcriptional regulator